MCSKLDKTFILNQKCLNRFTQEKNALEKDFENAQNAFSQVFLESAASINSKRLYCGLCVKEVLNCKYQRIPKRTLFRSIPCEDVIHKQIYVLQEGLEKSIVKSGWSIKISFMKLSSLLAHHDFLVFPSCELKEYYNQLLTKKSDMLKNTQILTPKLSYEQALQNMKEISYEIDQTKQRILGLTKKQRSCDAAVLDYSNFFNDEYKTISILKNTRPSKFVVHQSSILLSLKSAKDS